MLLNFIASCLLSVAVGTSCVHVNDHREVSTATEHLDTPKNALYSNDYLYGQYVFKYWQTDYDTYYFTEPLFDHDVIIEIAQIQDTGFAPCFATSYSNSGNNSGYYDFGVVDAFTMQYIASEDYINIDSYVYELDANFSVQMNDSTIDSYGELDYWRYCIYFLDYYQLDSEQLILFNTMFTQEYDTDYFTSYSGWYHMSSNFGVVPNFHARVLGQMLYSNALFNDVLFSNNSQASATPLIEFRYYSSGYCYETTAFPNYAPNYDFLNGVHNVHFSNCFMIKKTYDDLSLYGVFEFIPDNTDYGLDDLFVSIADTPITFITGLFNFELFGVTFFTAFLGIVTVIAIVFIIKKVI